MVLVAWIRVSKKVVVSDWWVETTVSTKVLDPEMDVTIDVRGDDASWMQPIFPSWSDVINSGLLVPLVITAFVQVGAGCPAHFLYLD